MTDAEPELFPARACAACGQQTPPCWICSTVTSGPPIEWPNETTAATRAAIVANLERLKESK